MGFFFSDATPTTGRGKGGGKKIPEHTAKQLQCSVCPYTAAGAKLAPTGESTPLVYFVRPWLTHMEAVSGKYYTDRSGQFLMDCLPKELEGTLRTSSLIRCVPNATNEIAFTCCRDFLEKDIEQTQPFIIVGIGDEVLERLLGQKGIIKWRGRVLPITVGKHTCWYYQILNPESILMKRRWYPDRKTGETKEFETEWDAIFRHDMNQLGKLCKRLPDAPAYSKADYLKGCEWTEGKQSEAELTKVLDWLKELQQYTLIGIDIETDRLRPYHSESKILSLAIGTFDHTYAFPYEYPSAWSPTQLAKLKKALRSFLLNSGTKIAHNAKFEQEWLAKKFGKDLLRKTTWACSQAQSYVLDERYGMHSLDVLTRVNFGFWLKDQSNIDRAQMLSYKLKEILPYNAMDTKWTFLLWHTQQSQLDKKQVILYNFLVRTLSTLVLAQMQGLDVSVETIREMDEQMEQQIKNLSRQIRQLPEVNQYNKLYGQYNPDSPDMLLKLLQQVLGLKDELYGKKKGTREKQSTEEPVLLELAEQFDIARLTLELRAVTKKHGTYIKPLYNYLDQGDGKLHTSLNPYVTVTGRLSSDDPALQNWPNRKGKEVRRVIVPPEGWWIVSADYGQIEARIIGLLSQDKNFCKALWEGYDVHMEWAQRIAQAYPEVIGGRRKLEDAATMKRFRSDVKNQWTFPAFYGAALKSIANYLRVPFETLEPIFKDFWKTFSGVKQYQYDMKKFYAEHQYIETMTGRRRHGPLTWNEILNSPVQGGAADLCIHAMNTLSELNHDGIIPVLNIHDDVTCYVRDDMLEEGIETIAEIMCTAPNELVPGINIPIAAEISCGLNWCDKEDVGVFHSTDYLKVDRTLRRAF